MSEVIRDFQGEGDVATEVLRVLFTYYALRQSVRRIRLQRKFWPSGCLPSRMRYSNKVWICQETIADWNQRPLSMTQRLQTQTYLKNHKYLFCPLPPLHCQNWIQNWQIFTRYLDNQIFGVNFWKCNIRLIPISSTVIWLYNSHKVFFTSLVL